MWMERTCSDLENMIDQLQERVPLMGRCPGFAGKNKHLDRFRRAQNVIHDIFNNGLMNRGREVGILGVRKRDLPLYVSNEDKWEIIEDRITNKFREIVMNAVREQFGTDVWLQVCHNRSSAIINKAIEEGRV